MLPSKNVIYISFKWLIYVNDFSTVQQETVELESIGEPEKSSGQGGIEKAKLDGLDAEQRKIQDFFGKYRVCLSGQQLKLFF